MSRPTVTTRTRRKDLEALKAAEAPSTRVESPQSAGKPSAPVKTIEDSPVAHLLMEDLLAIAGMDPDELAQLMDAGGARITANVGDKVSGVVSRVGMQDVLIEFGGKSEGTIDREEWPDAQIGDNVVAYVTRADEFGVRLSRRLSGDTAALVLEEAAASGAPVEGRVSGRNAGGYEVRVGTVRAFCPISHIARGRVAEDQLDSFVGQTLSFKVIESGDRVILSRRTIEEEAARTARDSALDGLVEGQIRDGVVKDVQPYGAFIDLGGIDGLLPRRELGPKPEETYAPGTTVQVRIVEVDRNNRRISLSSRVDAADPWSAVGKDFKAGQAYAGTVARQTDFGFFITLAPGLDGLLHRSRITGDAPEVGSELQVRLVSIDQERKRLELNLAASGPDVPAMSNEPVKGKITDIQHNGLTVALEDGRTGWLSSHEADLPAGTLMAQRYRVGKTIEARVSGAEARGGRVNLSMREADTSEGDWRAALRSGGGPKGFGTLAAALKGFK